LRFLIFIFSSILVIILHYFVITYINIKPEPKIVQKLSSKKLSVQMVQLKQAKPKVEKKVKEKKKIEKKIVKKDKAVKKKELKKITKKAKRKVVKTKKEEISKKIEKKVKETKKQVVEKKTQKIEKVQEKKLVNRKNKELSKKVSKVQNTKSIEKFEKFKKNYQFELWSYLDKNKRYPVASKRLKEQGVVTISFKILKNGSFKDIILESSSGKRRLDKSTLKMIKNLKKFKPFTEDINKSFINISVPIEYRL